MIGNEGYRLFGKKRISPWCLLTRQLVDGILPSKQLLLRSNHTLSYAKASRVIHHFCATKAMWYTWNKNWTRSIGKKEHWNTGNNTTGNIWCFECRTNTTFTIGGQDGFVNTTRSRLSPLGASIGANLTGWRHQSSTIAGFSLTTGNYFHAHFQWKLKLISNFSNCKDAWKKIHAFFCETFIYSCMK